ncbi:hypothetical protein Tco_0971634 [Tanacetum coccineum]
MMVQDQAKMGEGSANPTDPYHTPTYILPSTSQPQKKQKPKKPKRKDTQVPQSSVPGSENVHELSIRKCGPGVMNMRDTIAQTGFESVSKLFNDPLLARARVESYRDLESLGEDASKQGRINAIDADEDITLVNDQDDADMFDVNTLTGDAVLAEQNFSAASTKVSAATTTTTATILTPRKGIVITELEEPVKSMKKKDLVRLDKEIALKLQAEFDEEERLAREKDEANVALTEEWDDIQAKQRRKHFTAKRAEEKRNKPPTQAQQRKIMCTYLKNMEGKKPKDLKNKSFDSIQKMFDKAFKRVNTFVDFRTDLVEGSSKRAGTKLEQEVTKKQKVDDVQETAKVDNDQETAKIKELIEIVPDKEN